MRIKLIILFTLLILVALYFSGPKYSFDVTYEDLGEIISTKVESKNIHAITLEIKGTSNCPSRLLVFSSIADQHPDVWSVHTDTMIRRDWFHNYVIIDYEDKSCFKDSIELNISFNHFPLYTRFLAWMLSRLD